MYMDVPFVPLNVARANPSRAPFAALISRLRRHPLPLFFVACFVVTWPVQLLLVRTGAHLTLDAGPFVLVPLAVAACGPSLAAIAVTAPLSGWRGVRGLLTQARSWRIHPCWYVLALVLPTIILLAGNALFAAYTHDLPPGWRWIQLPTWQWSVAAFVPPVGEELGWRAFALPRLQRRINTLCAALIIGGIWGAWHLPIFLFPEMSLPDFPFFFAQVVASSVVMTWLYNSTGGRLGITLVAHLMLNLIFVNYPPMSATGVRPIACAALVAAAVAGIAVLAGGRSLRGLHGLHGLRGLIPAPTARRGSGPTVGTRAA
jgi:membrane protease YdiL (CAAX protease family)